MTDLTKQPLLTPFRMGELMLPNRIVMAPLTRQRAANPGHVRTIGGRNSRVRAGAPARPRFMSTAWWNTALFASGAATAV